MIDPVLYSAALRIAFSLFIACMCANIVCGATLFFFKTARVNAVLRHPYLQRRSFRQYPFSVRATITLDYFLRLAFPGREFWTVVKEANRLLAHVKPDRVPFDVKWPVIGFWGSCLLGLPTLAALWGLLLLGR
jgi:hypothetical protein